MRKLRYFGLFKDVNDICWTINIYKNADVSPVELLLAGNPLTIEYVQDDILLPLKCSSATIRILTDKILTDLYTGNVFDSEVEIMKADELYWRGYILPNVYNLDYYSKLDQLEIECIDTISALEYLKYTYIDGHNKASSLYEIIKHCLGGACADSRMYFASGYDPATLNNWTVLERNFFDENYLPMTCKEVLEHINKILGTTMCQQFDYYGIFDRTYYNGLSMLNKKYSEYIFADDRYTEYSFESIHLPKTVEVAENESNISFGEVYNQVNVIANLLEYEDQLINIEDKDNNNLVPISSSSHLEKVAIGDKSDNINDILNKQYYLIYAKLYEHKNCETRDSLYLDDSLKIVNNAYYTIGNFHYGDRAAAFIRYSKLESNDYGIKENDSSRLTFKNGLIIGVDDDYSVPLVISTFNGSNYDPLRDAMNNSLLLISRTMPPVFTTKVSNRTYNSADSLILNFDFRWSSGIFPDLPLHRMKFKKETELYSNYETWFQKVTDSYLWASNNESDMLIPFAILSSLLIGNLYWDGYNWVNKEARFVINGSPVKNGTLSSDTFRVFNTNNSHSQTSIRDRGMLIPLPNIEGELTLCLFASFSRPHLKDEDNLYSWNYDWVNEKIKSNLRSSNNKEIQDIYANWALISNLSLKYSHNEDYSYDMLDIDDSSKDIKYSVNIESKNVKEMSDISLYINTKNIDQSRKASYSYLMNKNGFYITTVLKNGVNLRPEEHIVLRYVEYYSKPKLIYTNTYKDVALEPVDYFIVPWIDNKVFFTGSMTFEPKYNTINIVGYEI